MLTCSEGRGGAGRALPPSPTTPRKLLFALALTLSAPAFPAGVTADLGGNLRFYQFLVTESLPQRREDAELALLRLTLDARFADDLRLETHATVQLASPAASAGGFSIASSELAGRRRYLDLEAELEDDENLTAFAELDRLALRWDRPSFRLVAGRQAVTWGVNFFWPVLDLFAPFAPQRIDRDYKPGVDAVRLVVPSGDFSEVELIGAVQGESVSDDGSLGGLGRFHTGVADFGFMLGSFHSDTVVGGFVTTDVAGMQIRSELAFTRSGDAADREIDRARFVRATAGVQRQLTPLLSLVGEVAWNGFGTGDPEHYRRIARADRVQRGEVTSLARAYAGVSLAWQAHPLLVASATTLVNWSDGSLLFEPSGEYSLSDNGALLFGLVLGIGPGSGPAAAGEARNSEYGAVPTTLWGAVKIYF